MAFRLVKDPTDTYAEYLPISSLALAVGDVIELNTGATAWTIANASSEAWERKAVVMEIVTTSAVEVKAIIANTSQIWDVDCTNNSSSSDDGDTMLLSATAGEVNNTGTNATGEEACFLQLKAVGAATNKRIQGYFTDLAGLNPDAA